MPFASVRHDVHWARLQGRNVRTLLGSKTMPVTQCFKIIAALLTPYISSKASVVSCVERNVLFFSFLKCPASPSIICIGSNHGEESRRDQRGCCWPSVKMHNTDAHPILCSQASGNELYCTETSTDCWILYSANSPSPDKQTELKARPRPYAKVKGGSEVPANASKGYQILDNRALMELCCQQASGLPQAIG